MADLKIDPFVSTEPEVEMEVSTDAKARKKNMKDDRLRVPVDYLYVEALGRATYVFATLEWNAVWCCERMETGYIHELARKTAGMIAGDLVRLAERHPNPQIRIDCLEPAHDFDRLVKLRNGILHGKPCTTETGEQRLSRDGNPWTPTMIDDAADEFAACSQLLNALLYNQLSEKGFVIS